MIKSSRQFPGVGRPDAGIALVAPLYVGSADRQKAEVERVMTPYRTGSFGNGFLSMSAFVSTDEENVLTYAQWTCADAYREFMHTDGLGENDEDATEPIRYKYYRGRVLEPGSVPSVLVPPVFDVDGRDRQRRSADSLVDGPLGRPFPGLIASHFHLSTDGSRVLNWAEWVDVESHVHFMESSLPHECLEAITMPGVRGIGGKRYLLAESIQR